MSKRAYDDVPTDYGGLRDNSRTPGAGLPARPSAAALARDLRRAGLDPDAATAAPNAPRLS